MRKLFRNRRAVSPVVSTVLMILVVIIGMSLLFDFFVNYTRDFQTGSGSAVLESMTIEDVSFTGSNGAQVWVYNVGKVNFTITSVYVNDQKTGLHPSSLEIAPGQHGMIAIDSAYSNCTIKIVTARGSAFEGRYS
jgi:flagellin-like protein